MTSRTTPSIDFRVWSSQLGTIDSFTDDLLKRLESTTDTKPLTLDAISASTISQGTLSTLDDENSKRFSISETPVYMEKTLEQSCQSFECFNIVKQHEHPSTSAAAAAAAVAAAEEKQKALLRKSTSISEKSVLRKSSAYFSHTIRKMKEPRRPSSPALIIKSKQEKKPSTWWQKLFSRA